MKETRRKGRLGKMTVALLAAGASLLSAAAKEPAFRRNQDMSRVRAIAKILPAEPGFPQWRIDNRKVWDRLAEQPGAAGHVRAAEEIAARPVPAVDDATYCFMDSRNRYTGPSAERARNIIKLAFGECLENKGRFLKSIVAHLDAIAAQRTWVNWYHDRPEFGDFKGLYHLIDLNSSENALNLGIVLDQLKGRLPEATVARVLKAMDEQVFDCYLAAAESGSSAQNRCGWFLGDSNWNAACHNQTVGAAVRVVADPVRRAKFIEGAERAAPFYLHGFSPEGYCQEGLDYWNYGFTEFLRLGLTVRAATDGKVDLFSDPQARRNFVYAFDFQMCRGCSAQFGDSAADVSGLNVTLGELVWPELRSSFAWKTLLGNDIEACTLIAFRKESWKKRDDPKPYVFPIRSYFESVGMLVCRPEPNAGGSRLYACIKGGHNGVPHNHNDAGGYEVAVDGVRMVADPGLQKYDVDTFGPKRYESKMRNSYGHDVPVVAGMLQQPGSQYEAKVVKTSFTNELDMIVLDLKGAYDQSSQSVIKRLERVMRYDRVRKTVTVADRVNLKKPGTFEVPITTYCRVERGKDPSELTLVTERRGEEVKLHAKITVSDGLSWSLKEEKIDNPERTNPTRLGIVLDEPVTKAGVAIRYSLK